MQLTYYVAPWDREPEAVEAPTAKETVGRVSYGPAEVRHGYTLRDVHDLAYAAVKRSHRFGGIDGRERLDAAWFAIVEFLLVCEERPRPYELIGAGMKFSDLLLREHRKHHGHAYDDAWSPPGSMPGFIRYWWTNAGPAPSPESRVVERATVRQIMTSLPPRQREALLTLAFVEDYDHAAKVMGITPGTFRVTIVNARRRFLQLWHEGETPSRPWRTDRRRRAVQDRYGKRRITASELEVIRGRHHAGETLLAIGKDYGVGKACLSSLLTGRTKSAPDPERETLRFCEDKRLPPMSGSRGAASATCNGTYREVS